MIQTLLDLPSAGIFAALILFYAATAAIILWLAFGWPGRGAVARFSGVVAPFFASVSVLFALLTGFLASDVGSRNRQAVQAVISEREAALTLHALSLAAASEMGSIRDALRAYLASVVTDEWPRMAEHEDSPATDAAMVALMREVSAPRIAGSAGQAVSSAMLEAVVRAHTARSLRLSLNTDRTNDLKWITVLIVAVLTQLAIGLVHLEKPRAQAAAQAVFSLAVAVTLSLIALQEYPFDGPLRVSSAPIEKALATISKDAP
jgi:hypothetical protein